MEIENSVQKTVRIRGSQTKLAEDLGVSQPSISLWCKDGIFPAEYVLKVEKITDGQVPRHESRPDIYPIEDRGSRDTQ